MAKKKNDNTALWVIGGGVALWWLLRDSSLTGHKLTPGTVTTSTTSYNQPAPGQSILQQATPLINNAADKLISLFKPGHGDVPSDPGYDDVQGRGDNAVVVMPDYTNGYGSEDYSDATFQVAGVGGVSQRTISAIMFDEYDIID